MFTLSLMLEKAKGHYQGKRAFCQGREVEVPLCPLQGSRKWSGFSVAPSLLDSFSREHAEPRSQSFLPRSWKIDVVDTRKSKLDTRFPGVFFKPIFIRVFVSNWKVISAGFLASSLSPHSTIVHKSQAFDATSWYRSFKCIDRRK